MKLKATNLDEKDEQVCATTVDQVGSTVDDWLDFDDSPAEVGSYSVVKLLGKGGFGRVYSATHTRLGHTVALKVNGSKLPVDGFLKEARILANLPEFPQGVYLPRVQDFFEADGRAIMVMDFIKGTRLLDHAAKEYLQPSEKLKLFEYVFNTVCFLHDQSPPIIHRDINPKNIIVREGDEGHIPFLVDFGISKIIGQETLTMKVANWPYAPPEQYEGRGHTDERSDIYSLGATLYHLLADKEPPGVLLREDRLDRGTIDIEPVDHYCPDMPELNTAVSRAMELEPDMRFQTVAEFREVIIQVQSKYYPPVSRLLQKIHYFRSEVTRLTELRKMGDRERYLLEIEAFRARMRAKKTEERD